MISVERVHPELNYWLPMVFTPRCTVIKKGPNIAEITFLVLCVCTPLIENEPYLHMHRTSWDMNPRTNMKSSVCYSGMVSVRHWMLPEVHPIVQTQLTNARIDLPHQVVPFRFSIRVCGRHK